MVVSPDAQELAARLDRIQKLAVELAKARDDLSQQQVIADGIARELHALRSALRLITP